MKAPDRKFESNIFSCKYIYDGYGKMIANHANECCQQIRTNLMAQTYQENHIHRRTIDRVHWEDKTKHSVRFDIEWKRTNTMFDQTTYNLIQDVYNVYNSRGKQLHISWKEDAQHIEDVMMWEEPCYSEQHPKIHKKHTENMQEKYYMRTNEEVSYMIQSKIAYSTSLIRDESGHVYGGSAEPKSCLQCVANCEYVDETINIQIRSTENKHESVYSSSANRRQRSSNINSAVYSKSKCMQMSQNISGDPGEDNDAHLMRPPLYRAQDGEPVIINVTMAFELIENDDVESPTFGGNNVQYRGVDCSLKHHPEQCRKISKQDERINKIIFICAEQCISMSSSLQQTIFSGQGRCTIHYAVLNVS